MSTPKPLPPDGALGEFPPDDLEPRDEATDPPPAETDKSRGPRSEDELPERSQSSSADDNS